MGVDLVYSAHLASGATSLVRCFLLTRGDGVQIGATEHDRDLIFDGVTFRAATALTASDAAASLGLAADELDAEGALSSDAISEADIRAGRYDGAEVQVWDVNFRDVSVRQLLGVYTIGEIERGATGFRAELRSRTAGLANKAGRSFVALCDASCGDARCGVDLDAAAFLGTGVVQAANELELSVTGLTAFADGWFDRGILTWISGANAGIRSEIRVSLMSENSQILKLWTAPPDPITAGDGFEVRAGCNKTFSMCDSRFGNAVNFRGFPHMTGEVFLTEYGVTGDVSQDGGSRFE